MVFKRKSKNNTYSDRGDYFEVTVNNSDLIYKVDKEYVNWMKDYTWYSEGDSDSSQRYLVSRVKNEKGVHSIVRYHVEIMRDELESYESKGSQPVIDHIDGDETNNLKSNMRVVTQSENNMNKRVQRNNTTGFVGVMWHTGKKMWETSITIENESIHLGNYYYLRNALRARIEAENKHFGEHSFYTRDEEYRRKVDELLSLPDISEPIIGSSRVPSSGHKYIYKNGNKYVIMINGIVKGRYSSLEEALSNRDKAFREVYGDREFIPHNKREEKVI